MAHIDQPPKKFIHPEWVSATKTTYANAEAERVAAERLVAESFRTLDETSKTTDRVQKDANKKLDQRIKDISYWESELELKCVEVSSEIEFLVELVSRLRKAIEACGQPLYVTQQCLAIRDRRENIDRCYDDPEGELNKEVEVYQAVMALFQRTIDDGTEQLRLNRKARYDMESDLKDKGVALGIDRHNLELKDHVDENRLVLGAARISSKSLTVEEWIAWAMGNIAKGEKQRQSSAMLRSIADGIMQSAVNDMRRQKGSCDNAFRNRIGETRKAKDKLEDHLCRINLQIREMEDNIARLIKSINSTDALRLSTTRLDNRSHRPNHELCRDPVQYRLVDEVATISESKAKLTNRLMQSQASLKGLDRKKLELEEQIRIKNDSLFCDECECMVMRNSIDIQCF